MCIGEMCIVGDRKIDRSSACPAFKHMGFLYFFSVPNLIYGGIEMSTWFSILYNIYIIHICMYTHKVNIHIWFGIVFFNAEVTVSISFYIFIFIFAPHAVLWKSEQWVAFHIQIFFGEFSNFRLSIIMEKICYWHNREIIPQYTHWNQLYMYKYDCIDTKTLLSASLWR